jgi:hypothetical protein
VRCCGDDRGNGVLLCGLDLRLGVSVPLGTHPSDVIMRLINNRCGGRIRLNPRRKIMARNQTNTSQARELTEAELDRVSGGGMRKAGGDSTVSGQSFLRFIFG